MSLSDDIDRKRMDLNRLYADMRSISPKLGLYNELKKKAEQIRIQISELEKQRVFAKRL